MNQERTSEVQTTEVRLQKAESELSGYARALDRCAIVARTDQKGIINYVNQNFCQVSRYSSNELLGQDHRILNSGYHSKQYIHELWQTISSGNMWRGEFRNRAKDQSLYWVDATIVPLVNEAGPYQYLTIQYEISPKKSSEEQLLAANEQLKSAIRQTTFELTDALERYKALGEMKSRFIAIASHEFRTPLSAILSSLALLEHYTQPGDDDKRLKHIARIKLSVRDLTDMLDDLLSLRKFERGRIELLKKTFDINELLADSVAAIQEILIRSNQQIHVQHSGPAAVCLDQKILQYILLNLLSNASKFSGDHQPIKLVSSIENDLLRISVIDRGIGIPPDAQGDVFTKFYRARNAVHIDGMGVGLYIVKRLVEVLDGEISFRRLERGTEFFVSIPIVGATSVRSVIS